MSSHLKSARCTRKSSQHTTLRQSQLRLSQSSPSMSLESEHDPKEAFYSYVLETIVSLNISFRSVENPLWREMVLWQNHKFPLPSAATLRRRLDIMAVNAQQLALHGLVPGARCALFLDNWSSPGTRISFMGIMATFITAKWEYQEALIGFEYLDGAHTGKELATILAQRALLGSIRLNPKNSELQVDWDENSITELDGLSVDKGIPWTLAKY
ncbi:hypothetical protein VE00_05103 [Pseudogymnoascus sp. WSF 3629]|nr:hypothetical protein VE00_05103 [Pseudogymnoascus sp. WSF 3629]